MDAFKNKLKLLSIFSGLVFLQILSLIIIEILSFESVLELVDNPSGILEQFHYMNIIMCVTVVFIIV